MNANLIPVSPACATILPGYQFADAYAVPAPDGMNAIAATLHIMNSAPRWITYLMKIRNGLVGLFGLKTAPINRFPIISQTPEQVVLGFDDSHLDFRIVVMLTAAPCEQLSISTLVRTHNWFGRTYLFLIMPFHKTIARHMIKRVWL